MLTTWKRKILKKAEEKKIEKLIQDFEQKTGTELILVIAKSSDPYPGASLRFAIVFSTLLTMIATLVFDFRELFYIPLFQLISVLFFALLGNISFIKKLTLNKTEVQRETNEKAMEFFYTYGPSRAQHKVSILLYISLLEKQLRLLVDQVLSERLEQKDLDSIIQILQEEFKSPNFYDGLETAIETLEGKILHFFPQKVLREAPAQLQNKIIWES